MPSPSYQEWLEKENMGDGRRKREGRRTWKQGFAINQATKEFKGMSSSSASLASSPSSSCLSHHRFNVSKPQSLVFPLPCAPVVSWSHSSAAIHQSPSQRKLPKPSSEVKAYPKPSQHFHWKHSSYTTIPFHLGFHSLLLMPTLNPLTTPWSGTPVSFS